MNCSVCQRNIEEENPSVLSMGAFATPRYICEECDGLIATARSSRDYDEIREALDRLSTYLTDTECDDRYVIATMRDVLDEAGARALAIKEGVYDFSLDEQEEQIYEIPEELCETEEDRELDRRDQEAEQKMDKVMNWMWIGAAVGFVAYLVWLLFLR